MLLLSKDDDNVGDHTAFGRFHGTGDAFDGVLIASILKGCSLKESMIEAHRFVYACMEESLKMEYEEREGLMIEKNLYMLV